MFFLLKIHYNKNMADLIRKTLISFRKKPDFWFFCAFLATSTLSIRKVLFYYPVKGVFNEYMGVYIYLSDIFLFLTLFTWFFILCNKNNILSILTAFSTLKINCSTWNNYNKILNKSILNHLFSYLKNLYQQVNHNFILFFPLFLVIFSFISIIWSENHQVALFRSLKILEFFLLFIYISKLFHVEHLYKLKITFKIIVGIGIFQSIIGIIQILSQQSLGLIWLKESITSTQLPGVAKIVINGLTCLRTYGLFPHPNIFGGFLVFSIIISILYFKLFHVEQFSNPKKASEKMFFIDVFNKNVPRGTFIFFFIILIQFLALFLTFSKSAILGLIIAFIYIYTKNCSTWNNFIFFNKEYFIKKVFLILCIIFFLFFLLKPDLNSIFSKSLQERGFYTSISSQIFILNPILGLGSGQFIAYIEKIQNVQIWQLQPVHNVFLLLLNDFGILVLLLFLIFLFKLFSEKNDNCSTWNNLSKFKNNKSIEKNIQINALEKYHFKAVFVSFVFIMLFDHYLWDIQQGQILLWLIFGFILSNKKSFI